MKERSISGHKLRHNCSGMGCAVFKDFTRLY